MSEKKLTEKEQFLVDAAQLEGSVTSWHLNDVMLDWYDKFYRVNGKSFDTARNAFTRTLRNLVKKNIFYPSIRTGTGWAGVTDFGVNYQTTWFLVGHPRGEDIYPFLKKLRQ